MNIALVTIYGSVYERDRIFDSTSCTIGENLLVPGIELKKRLESLGHNYHTVDMYDLGEVDTFLFMDLPIDSILTISSLVDFLKYIVRRKWRKDYLLKAVFKYPKKKRCLMLQEPPTVCPHSYQEKFHKYFDRIITWNDSLVDGRKYEKYFYPQVLPTKEYKIPFGEKKLFAMIAGNKNSITKNELYSERRASIDFFEKKKDVFDLYGFGWENEKLLNYKGMTDAKLDTLSKYKYSICYENMTNVKGYITEKIFDCFFARCIPVYWGADNIADFVPPNTFIDRRNFKDTEAVYEYVKNISEQEYDYYLNNIQKYLQSKEFQKTFSVEAYINKMIDVVL